MSFVTKTSTLEQQITFDADDPRHSNLNSFNSLVNYETDFKFNKYSPSSPTFSSSSSNHSESDRSESMLKQKLIIIYYKY